MQRCKQMHFILEIEKGDFNNRITLHIHKVWTKITIKIACNWKPERQL